MNRTIDVPEKYRHRFTVREILSQIHLDLFSKGVQTGYSATYSWLAGQFGHFASGLIFVVLVRAFYHTDGTLWNRIAPGAFLGFFIAFKEWRDYRAAVKDAAKAAVFPMDKADVAKDAATAVWFVVMGIFIGEALTARFPWGFRLSLILIVISVFIGRWWLTRKKCFQQSDVAVVYRLSNVRIQLSRGSQQSLVNDILEFTSLKGRRQHMLISGPLQSGKTTLACAIGAEHTFQLGPARYLTYLAFREISKLKRDPTSTENRPLWPLAESNIVILDDIDMAMTGGQSAAQSGAQSAAQTALNAIDPDDLENLRKRRTIWVLSDVNQTGVWQSALKSCLGDIFLVQLLRGPVDMPAQEARVVAKGFD